MNGQWPSMLGWVAGWWAGGGIAVALLAGLAIFAAARSIRRGRGRFSLAGPRDNSADRQLLAIAGEMLCLHDGTGIILGVSGAVREVTGLTAEEITGVRLDDFIHLDDRLSLLSLWGRLTAGHDVSPAEFRFIQPAATPSGSRRGSPRSRIPAGRPCMAARCAT